MKRILFICHGSILRSLEKARYNEGRAPSPLQMKNSPDA